MLNFNMPRQKQQTNNELSVDIAVISEKVANIEKKVTNIENKLDADYVTQDEFDPIRKIVYGMVTVVLMAVLGAMVALVVRTI